MKDEEAHRRVTQARWLEYHDLIDPNQHSSDERDMDDKNKIYRMLYGHHGAAEVRFAHRPTEIVHLVLADASAIGVTWCGTCITRNNSSEWRAAVDEPITCMACIAEVQ